MERGGSPRSESGLEDAVRNHPIYAQSESLSGGTGGGETQEIFRRETLVNDRMGDVEREASKMVCRVLRRKIPGRVKGHKGHLSGAVQQNMG